jgi:threonine-phosphate decarboxylase
MIEGHGGDSYRYDKQIAVDFSDNIYRRADLTALQEHLASHLHLLLQSPTPQPWDLEALIAERLDISPEAVMLTNGSTEAIYLIAALFRGRASIIPQPTYNEYADACRMFDHIISYENNDERTELPDERVYWICNPNNPSGNVLMKGFIDYIVRRSSHYIFVVDQSYEAYSAEPLLKPSEVKQLPNLLILHSIGKTYGVPGLRLGYITAHPVLIQQLRAMRMPWPIGSLSLEAGKFLIEHGQPVSDHISELLEEAERLRTNLRKIEGVRVFETKTTYMMCELLKESATSLKQYLVSEHGMLIRDCSNFYGLSDSFFRVASQTAEENDALVAAVRQFVTRNTAPKAEKDTK